MSRFALAAVAALLGIGVFVVFLMRGGPAAPQPIQPGQTAQPVAQQAQPEIPDLTSYAIGYSLGEQVRAGLAEDGVTADAEVVLRGFREGLTDQEPAIDAELLEDELVRIQDELQRRIIERELATNEEFRKLAEDKLAASTAFMEENGKREGVNTGPRGGQWIVLREGDGPSPTLEDTVEVNYVGTLVDGTPFERADGRIVELDTAIEGAQTILTQMKVGGKWRVFVPPALGYGVAGRPPAVGPNEVLVLEVELVRIVE